MKSYRLVWLDGKIEVITGKSLGDAMLRAGYDVFDHLALDYFVPMRN